MQRGRRLGVDVGAVRVGVAISDPDGLIATPLVTLPAAGAIGSIVELIGEHEIVEIVVGLPLHLSGQEGAAAVASREFAEALSKQTSVAIHFVDERLSTTNASRQMAASGRSSREQRGLIDQAAAVGILQLFLDQERSR